MGSSTSTHKLLDVVELVGYDADSSTILKELIQDYDNKIADALKKGKVVKIPYIGNLRKNLVKSRFNKFKNDIDLKEFRKTVTKEEYVKTVKQAYGEIRRRSYRDDRLRVLFRENRANNRAKYDRLCATAGKPYANMFIYAICLMEVVPATPDNEEIKFKFKLKK